MDPSGQAFVDYALPDWASADSFVSTKALGEESGSGLVGLEAPGDSPPEDDWGNTANSFGESPVFTTQACGEESGDACGIFYPPDGLGNPDFSYTIDIIDPITGSEILNWYWSSGERGFSEEVDPTRPPDGVETTPDDSLDPFDQVISGGFPDDFIMTTMAIGEESGSPFYDSTISDPSDSDYSDAPFDPTLPSDATNPSDMVDSTLPSPGKDGSGDPAPVDPFLDSEDEVLDPALSPPTLEVIPSSIEPSDPPITDTFEPMISECWVMVPPVQAPPQSYEPTDSWLPTVEEGPDSPNGESGLDNQTSVVTSLPLEPEPPTQPLEGSEAGEEVVPVDQALARRQILPTDGGVDPVDVVICSLPPQPPARIIRCGTPAEVVIPASEETEQPPVDLSGVNLTMTEVVVPSIAIPGDGLDVSWTFANTGASSIYASSTSASVTYSRNDIYGDDDDLWIGTLYSNNYLFWQDLPSQASVTSTQAIYLSADHLGTGHLFFKVDPYDYLAESDENDNVFMQPINVVLPNLSISDVSAPAQAVSGERIQVAWTVTNQGDFPLNNPYCYDGIVFSKNEIYGDGDDINVFTNYGSAWTDALQPQASITYQQDIYLPYQAGGDGYLLFALDYFNYLPETDETDNVLSQPISILQPNLAIANVSAPTRATAGDQIDISWSVVNQGDVPLNSPRYFDSVVFSKNDIFGDEDDVYLQGGFYFQQDSLQPLDQQTVSQSLVLPSNYVGDAYLLFKVDSGNYINETDESDNVFSRQITMVERNLTILDFSVSATVTAGSVLDFSITVRNDGEASTNYFTPKQIVFSTNQTFGDADDVWVGYFDYYWYGAKRQSFGSESADLLQPGDTQTVSIPVYISDYLSGSGYLLIQSDMGETSFAPLDITPFQYTYWDNLDFCGYPVFKFCEASESVAFDASNSWSSTSSSTMYTLGMVNRTAVIQGVEDSFVLVDTVSSASPLEGQGAEVSQPSSQQFVVVASNSNDAPRRVTLDNELDLFRFFSLFDVDQATSTDSGDDKTLLPSSPRSAKASATVAGSQDQVDSVAVPNAEGLLLSLLEKNGVASHRKVHLISQDQFTHDPLSGLKLGEVVTAI